MYALLDFDNKTVIACFTPDIPYDKVLEEANNRILVKMTPENSPAYIKGTYVDGKFYPPKEIENG
jgi:hypothetical protein